MPSSGEGAGKDNENNTCGSLRPRRITRSRRMRRRADHRGDSHSNTGGNLKRHD